MQLSDLRKFSRLYVSTLKGGKLDNTELDVILKAGVKLTATLTECLSKATNINAESGVSEYLISEKITNYVSMDSSGIWFNRGTVDATEWAQLIPVNRKWLDENIGGWRDADSGSPTHYYVEENTIGLYPAPDEALAGAIKVYHFRQPTTMVNDTDYPFEGSSPIPQLQILDDCVLAYVKWKCSPIVGKEQQENPYEAEFYREALSKQALIKKRTDLTAYSSSNRKIVKFRGRRV